MQIMLKTKLRILLEDNSLVSEKRQSSLLHHTRHSVLFYYNSRLRYTVLSALKYNTAHCKVKQEFLCELLFKNKTDQCDNLAEP